VALAVANKKSMYSQLKLKTIFRKNKITGLMRGAAIVAVLDEL
jgi:hypothetical protein